MPARIMLHGRWQSIDAADDVLNRTYHRDSAGKFSSGGAPGQVDKNMSQADYEQSYPPEDVYDESSFGDGGYVQSTTSGTLQIGIRNKDGTTDVHYDLDTPEEGGQIVEAVDWARSHDLSARGHRPHDDATGFVDWHKAGEGLIAGVRPDGRIGLAHDDGSQGIEMSPHEAGQFIDALSEQIGAAREAAGE